MCGSKYAPREKIEIQAAGTGTNKANQSDSTFDHTDWMLVVVLILVFLGLLFVIVKRIQKHMKKTVIHEIELHELRRSTMLLNTSSSSSRTQPRKKDHLVATVNQPNEGAINVEKVCVKCGLCRVRLVQTGFKRIIIKIEMSTFFYLL